MATTKKETELTVEERLKALYQLQTILSEVDRYKIQRGELPEEVHSLEDEIVGLQTRLAKYDAEVAELNQIISKQNAIQQEAMALIEKYTRDQDNVRNNREYDNLTKEIGWQQLQIDLATKNIGDKKKNIEDLNSKIEAAKAQLDFSESSLTEKKNELDDIINETKDKEEKLREQAKKLEAAFDDERLLTAFKRIRKSVRNGLGVVYVQRNSCGGCFNRIPAQRQTEIRMHKKIIVCEYCGRILVDPELAGVTEEKPADAKETAKKK